MALKLIAVVSVLLAIGIGVGYWFGFDFGWEKSARQNVNSFEDCVEAGYPVMESYPPRCLTSDGRSFTQVAGNETVLAPDIVVTSPSENQAVRSPLKVSGRAVGPWFFEANAGLKVVDSAGNVLGQSYITAIGDWMTEEFVEFTGEVVFDPGDALSGEVVFENANPSGDPERSLVLRIPVKFE